MKFMSIAMAALAFAGFSQIADAKNERRNRPKHHCKKCVKLYDRMQWKREKVSQPKRVVVGYKKVLVGYEECFENRIVRCTETRTVYRRVVTGYDRCGRPIYCKRAVQIQVPVSKTVRVRVKKPKYEKQPIYEVQSHERWKWVRVRTPVYTCFRR